MAWWHKSTQERLADLEERFERILEQRHDPDVVLRFLKHMEQRIMAAIDDLKANVSALTTEVTRIAAEIDQLLTVITTPGTSEADIKAAADQIAALTSQLKAASDKSDAAVP